MKCLHLGTNAGELTMRRLPGSKRRCQVLYFPGRHYSTSCPLHLRGMGQSTFFSYFSWLLLLLLLLFPCPGFSYSMEIVSRIRKSVRYHRSDTRPA
jgi:hypothetical protein